MFPVLVEGKFSFRKWLSSSSFLKSHFFVKHFERVSGPFQHYISLPSLSVCSNLLLLKVTLSDFSIIKNNRCWSWLCLILIQLFFIFVWYIFYILKSKTFYPVSYLKYISCRTHMVKSYFLFYFCWHPSYNY